MISGEGMNSATACRRLAVLACLIAAAGCDAVKDVTEEPAFAPPPSTAVLQGTVTGLGTRRPIGLQYNGQDTCVDPAAPEDPNVPPVECKFFGVLGQQTSAFSFGSLPYGTPYDITVSTQPFGRNCTVSNGTGTVGTGSGTPITVTCANDDTPRYAVSGTIAPAASATPGLKVILTTEEGVREIDATGLSTFTFPEAVFDSGFSLPVFGWSVTATVPAAVEGDPVNNCNVTGGPVAGTGSNIDVNGDATGAPSGDVSGIQVTSCAFSVSVRADAASGGPSSMSAGGLTLALRHQATGEDVQTLDLPSFGSAGSRSFTGVLSNVDAIYELVITRQPDSQVCVPGFGSSVSGSSATDAGAVLLLQPSGTTPSPGRWLVNRALRCRALPAEANQLRGAYQQFTRADDGALQPTRNFLAFFENGTYLFGAHASSSSASGVEHGFYTYNAVAGTLSFLPYVDTSGTGGLSSNGAPGPNWTGVAKTAAPGSEITAMSGSNSIILRQPETIDAQMTGAWATPDGRRLWVYNGSTYNGFHAGVNGMANAQDACFPIEDAAALSGYFTRRGNATTCALASGSGTIFTLDIPNATTTPRMPLGFTGKWPQSGSNADGRPSSPVNYTIEPGSPDTLTIQNTLHDGSPVNPPIVMRRLLPN